MKSKKLKSSSDAPGITVTVQAECTIHPEASNHVMHFCFEDCCVTVSDDSGEIGSIQGCIGGGVELSDTKTGLTFTINAKDLWHSFRAAIEKHPDYARLKGAQ